MSDPLTRPTADDAAPFESIRRDAKQLLRRARAGEPPVLAALRAQLPRLAELDDATMRDRIRLADVQHAIARKLGYDSWAALRRAYEQLDPLNVQAARFLTAMRDDDMAKALELLDAWPGIARHDLACACVAGDVDAVAALLAADPQSAQRTTPPDHTPPLVYAVLPEPKRARGVSEADQVSIVRMLLDAGADPNTSIPVPDGSGRIPVLYFPCEAGNVAVARLLLERGAAPTDGESLYHAAQHDRREVLELLRAAGADLSRGPAPGGSTPLYFLASHTAANAISAAAMRGMQWLLEHGADPNVTLGQVADGETSEQLGEVPLHRIAAGLHDEDVVHMLLAHGAQVDVARADGLTPYVLAVRSGNHAAADALAAAGADVSRVAPVDRLLAACLDGKEAEARAIVAAHPGLVAGMDDAAARAIHLTLVHDDVTRLALMLSLGWRLDVENEWGGTMLHWAAWWGRVAHVRALIAHGAPLNVRDSRHGSSPIAWAAHGSRFCPRANDDDYVAIVNALLDAGATRAESYNKVNETPESLARPAVVHALRARGFAP